MSGTSLDSAVDRMLQEVVTSVLGKRKQPSGHSPHAFHRAASLQEQRCPNVKAAEPLLPEPKKPRLDSLPLALTAQSPAAAAAVAPSFPPPPAAPAPCFQPAPDSPMPPAPVPYVDLEAVVGELMGADEDFPPSTQPAAAPAVAHICPAAAAASPTAVIPAASEASDEPTTSMEVDAAAEALELLPSTQPATAPAPAPDSAAPTCPAAAAVPASPAAVTAAPASVASDEPITATDIEAAAEAQEWVPSTQPAAAPAASNCAAPTCPAPAAVPTCPAAVIPAAATAAPADPTAAVGAAAEALDWLPSTQSTAAAVSASADAAPTCTCPAAAPAPASPAAVILVAASSEATAEPTTSMEVDMEEAAEALELLPRTQPASSRGISDPAKTEAGPSEAAAAPPSIPTAAPTVPLAAALPASQPTEPPAAEPTEPLPLLPSPVAAAAKPTKPPASVLPDAPLPTGRLVRRAAPTASSGHTQPASPTSSYINMLVDKGDLHEEPSSPELGSPSGGHGGWTSSSGEGHYPASPSLPPPAHTQAAPPVPPAAPAPRTGPPELVADYLLDKGKEVGSGGLGCVYSAVHTPSGRQVALKLGSAFCKESGPKDFTWSTFLTEWNTYARLASSVPAASPLPWLAQPYEFGLLEDGAGGVAPWLTMSLLGPSLHSINQKHRGAMKSQLHGYARGMLAALEGLHRQGYIHNDIKPANFVTSHGFDPSQPRPQQPVAAPADGDVLACLQAPEPSQADPQLFLIDFGFTLRWDPLRAGAKLDFVGTPDFAASAVLQSKRPGLRDDLEALGYTLVEMVLGELPWDVTKTANSKGDMGEVTTWDNGALEGMLDRRDSVWVQSSEDGSIPAWLVEWVEYCRCLPASAVPDYDRLRGLIADGERQVAAAAKARAGSKAWLGDEE